MSYDLRRLGAEIQARVRERPGSTLQSICLDLGISRLTGSAAIKRAGGSSFRALRRLAIGSLLGKLIRDAPTMSVEQISSALGFRSPSSLRSFTRHNLGKPPSAIRNATRMRSLPAVLILARRGDEHAEAVAGALKRRRIRSVQLDGLEMPGTLAASVCFDGHANHYELKSEEGILNLNEVSSVWNRRPRLPAAPPGARRKRR